MMRTTTKPTLVPGRTPPAPTAPKSSMPTGCPGIRGQVAGPWNPTSWNSREPEKAIRPIVEEGSTPDKDKNQPPQIAYPMEGVSATPGEDDEQQNIAIAKPLRPLTSAPVDSWPTISRSGDKPDEPKKKGATIDYPGWWFSFRVADKPPTNFAG